MGLPGSSWKPAPVGKKFKYKCMLLNGLENFVDPAIVPLSERTDLPPEAKALLFTIDTLPTKGGLESSRWYTPPSPPTPPKSVATSVSSFLNPTVKEFTPTKASHYTTSPKSDSGSTSSSLNPAAKAFSMEKMSSVTETTTPHTPAVGKGLTTSRWAQSACKSSTAKTSPMVELDPASPVKAQDIPVHLRGYYIAPHLRPAGLKALPGKPLLPYIEPHQRVGILPEVIPNDVEYQTPPSKAFHPVNGDFSTPKPLCSTPLTYQAPPTCAATGSGNNNKDSKPRVPYLALTFEEFIGHKREIPAAQQAPTTPMGTGSNTIREKIQLPPDCFSKKLAPGRDGLTLQAKAQKRGNVTTGLPWPVQEALTISLGKDSQTAATEKVDKGKQQDLLEPKIYSTAELPLVDTRVQQTDREFVKDIQEIILFEAMNPQPGILDLTRDALIRETGGAPKETSSSGVDQFVSDDGIEVPVASDDVTSPNNAGAHVGDSRGYLAELDDSLQQGDGSWMPVPCSWENERSSFQNAFIPQYIALWAKTVPAVTGKVDMDRDEFKSGLSPLSLLNFEEPLAQPLCYPDVQQSDNVAKQLVQTAEIDSRTFANRVLKKQRVLERQAQIAAQQQFYIEEDIIVNPNIPKIEIYLRPAQMKDISGITSIYNHYVLNSIIPEDQSPIIEQHMQTVLKDAQEQGLPFIVAIKGRVPPSGNTKSAEHVLGFAYTDFFNYGLGGTHMGASRFTGVIQLYVEPNHTRKGVGRSLMDRILVCSSTTHASKEGYNWNSPNARDAAVYGQPGGAHKFHQLFIYRPIEIKEDPDHEWIKQWLHNKFFIEEVGRLKSVARSSSVGTTARMLDVLTFQFEAALAGGFDITC